jgi:malonate-semialdehyde dehydrogenase (acetylating)/methylmalonate-semialdehyde dehydrogenase
MRTIDHWIDGTVTTSPSGRQAPVWNPATGEAQAQVDLADDATVDAAVRAAQRAFQDWHASPLSTRTRILFAFRQLLSDNVDRLAEAITAEHGKVVGDAAGEVQRGLEVVEYACAVPELLKGAYSRQVSRGVDVLTVREPVGVVAGITPFNFPAMVPLWMFPLAIACGNTFVLKPSERDPSASLILAELLHDAGLPDGVFNVVQGDRTAVGGILDHPGVAAVSFVGSTPIARHVHERASAHGKRVQALGGAKNHAVVLPDADMAYVADQLIGAAFGSAGERCMAVSVAVPVADAVEPLTKALVERASRIRVGVGTDPTSEMGPVVSQEARDRICGLIGSGEDEGASVVLDGRPLAEERDGFWVGPTVLTDVTTDMKVYREEVFGPVLCVVPVAHLDEAIDLVNASPYANGTALFTSDGSAARRFEREIQVGMIGINVPIPVPVSFHSFGGWKDSLFGDTHVYGPEGVRFYTRAKAITSRWPGYHTSAGIDYTFPSSR